MDQAMEHQRNTEAATGRRRTDGIQLRGEQQRRLLFGSRQTRQVVAAALLIALFAWESLAATHPLDPLSADEIKITTQVVRSDSRMATAPIPIITLEEPSKASVLVGQNTPRRARAIVSTNSGVFEAIVDIAGKRLISVSEHAGAQGPVTNTEAGERASFSAILAFRKASGPAA